MTRHLVFIASGGRTGTKFLGDLLSQVIEDCWSEHEADMFDGFNALTLQRIRTFGLWHMVVGRGLGRTGLRGIGTRFLAGERSLESAAAQIRKERAAYHAGLAQGLVIESYWRWWMLAGDVPRIFPEARTIGVVRDPRRWIASWLSHQTARGGTHWTWRLPPGPITPERIGDARWAARWDAMSPVARLAWEWKTINGRLVDGAARDPAMRVWRFEDLFGPDADEMPALIEFASAFPDHRYAVRRLDGFTAERRNQSSADETSWQAWSEADRAIVDELCGELMDHFGYPALTASRLAA